MTVPYRGLPVALLATAVVSALTACSGPGHDGAQAGSAPTSGPPAAAAVQAPDGRTTTPLVVPPGEGGGALSTPHTLTVPAGWTAKVWARVPNARMEAWTPEGNLLVSEPGAGKIVELRPGPAGTATVTTVATGLFGPQGMAFARLDGGWVLYVGEYDEIDRYPWRGGRIGGARTVIAAKLPSSGAHPSKDVTVTAAGTVYFIIGSGTNASPADRTTTPQRAVVMAVNPDGTDLRVVERGVRNGEGLAVAPNGAVWTAVNERDNVPYPSQSAYGTDRDAFGQVIQAYVNNHPPDEVAQVTAGTDLGWPYCDPDQDDSSPSGSLADVPLVPDAATNPGGSKLNCSALAPVAVGLPAHSAPLGMTFLQGSKIAAPWSDGAALAVHGSWNRQPPQSPAVLWLAWNASKGTLEPAATLVGGFENADHSFWGRPVDAVPGPDGALYVSDDTAGAIYRLVPAS